MRTSCRCWDVRGVLYVEDYTDINILAGVGGKARNTAPRPC